MTWLESQMSSLATNQKRFLIRSLRHHAARLRGVRLWRISLERPPLAKSPRDDERGPIGNIILPGQAGQ